ncbi:hypothetical protein BYT27DRAFT_7024111, partial [Phlegmacium glaucopus]
LPTNILAFRTITMLLAKIQQERPLIVSNALDNNTLDLNAKEELRISNAFANLAVTDTAIVALAT